VLAGLGIQGSDFSNHQISAGGEQLAWSRVAVGASEPEAKLDGGKCTAVGSPYGLLVTWQRIQSPRPASAETAAGRSFA
jgi:hypothetical protein